MLINANLRLNNGVGFCQVLTRPVHICRQNLNNVWVFLTTISFGSTYWGKTPKTLTIKKLKKKDASVVLQKQRPRPLLVREYQPRPKEHLCLLAEVPPTAICAMQAPWRLQTQRCEELGGGQDAPLSRDKEPKYSPSLLRSSVCSTQILSLDACLEVHFPPPSWWIGKASGREAKSKISTVGRPSPSSPNDSPGHNLLPSSSAALQPSARRCCATGPAPVFSPRVTYFDFFSFQKGF